MGYTCTNTLATNVKNKIIQSLLLLLLSFNYSGYMAPEYEIEGLYSTKSDVFSYGVLALEIISGKRNNHYHIANPRLNLIGHVSKIYYHFVLN